MALAFIMLLMYQAWQEDYGPQANLPAPATSTPTSPTATPSTPSASGASHDVLPDTTAAQAGNVGSIPNVPTGQEQTILPTADQVTVRTDLLELKIDTIGGDIRKAALLDYPLEIDEPDNPFVLMQEELPKFFIAQSGLLPKETSPTHQAVFQAEQLQYQIADNQDTLSVTLTWRSPQGIEVQKIYHLQRGSYVVRVEHVVTNAGTEPWVGRVYGQLQRTDLPNESAFLYTYTGAAISSPELLYEKITFSEIRKDELQKEQRPGWVGGWAGMLQHYFVAAWVPQVDQVFHYYSNYIPEGARYVIGLYSDPQSLAPNNQLSFEMQLYVGPKLQHEMEALAPGLDLTVDYGWLWFIAKPLFWSLEFIHSLVGNWGWAIIILTILIKLAFFHLSATSYKSMANMRKLHPRLIALKERYADDKARLHQAMMDLYKKEKINPLGGCLPILVQIPVFIALYWVLLESVELRQAPFMFWLNDLSTPDPYFILPLIMGVTMLIQQHLNPAPLDPVQQKVMMILPVVFSVFFAFFPSGLVLYWVVNNILSIAQQWVITRKIAGDV